MQEELQLEDMMGMKLTSRDFEHEGVIPDKYSKEGGNISPPLAWTGVPDGAKSLVLIVDDPDAPSGVFVHWLLYGLSSAATELPEGLPATPTLPNGVRQGRNGFGELGYDGPQPPSGTHRYFFRLYAIDTDLTLRAGVSREELDSAIEGHVLEQTELMGRYEHKEPSSRAA
jgi:Raf kinase inhibitor-like YbhB/YbcL family protein